MNKFRFFVYPAVAAFSLFAAVAAHADDITPDDTATQVWTNTKTRTQVNGELSTARADGSMKVWSTQYDHLRAAPRGAQSRAQVNAAVLAERHASTSQRLYGEDSGSFYLSQLQQRQQQQGRPDRDGGRLWAGAPAKGAQR